MVKDKTDNPIRDAKVLISGLTSGELADAIERLIQIAEDAILLAKTIETEPYRTHSTPTGNNWESWARNKARRFLNSIGES